MDRIVRQAALDTDPVFKLWPDVSRIAAPRLVWEVSGIYSKDNLHAGGGRVAFFGGEGEVRIRLQQPGGHLLMMPHHRILADPVQGGHGYAAPPRASRRGNRRPQ